MAIAVLWYYIVGVILIGLFVAFIAMYGWTKLKDIWTRMKKPDDTSGGGT
jgi:multisubunit Na+/H+ antiporter MnhG subunit